MGVFDTQGNFIKRLVSQGSLNSPWGMATAPTSFGRFGGDLLIGNFGDGTIHAFDPLTGQLIGTLDGSNGTLCSCDDHPFCLFEEFAVFEMRMG